MHNKQVSKGLVQLYERGTEMVGGGKRVFLAKEWKEKRGNVRIASTGNSS